jgi:hypothetical protein
MVLPNGFVVGELVRVKFKILRDDINFILLQAISLITNSDGVVECPFTKEKWPNPKIEKVYVM